MTDEVKRLVNALRKDTEWARANGGKSIIALCGDLDAAADMIEKLAAQFEKSERVILNTFEISSRTIAKLEADRDAWQRRCEAAERDIRGLIKTTDCACDFCTHRRVCKGCENEKTCSTDFEFGTCPAMIDTPCNGCYSENGFQWRGPCAGNGGEPT